MISEGAEEELEALALDDLLSRGIVDDKMCKVGLTGDRAEGRELGCREADEIERSRPGVRYIVEYGFLGRSGQLAGLAEVSSLRSVAHGRPLPPLGRRVERTRAGRSEFRRY